MVDGSLQFELEVGMEYASGADGLRDRQRRIVERAHGRYAKPIYQYCLRRLCVSEVAEDITSSVFVTLIENIDELIDGQADVGRWLFVVARNASVDHVRTMVRRREIFDKVSQDRVGMLANAPNEACCTRMDWPLLHEAIASLRPSVQGIVLLRYFHGLGNIEIAEILGLNPATVRVTLMRGLGKLRRKLAIPFGERHGPGRSWGYGLLRGRAGS